MTQKTGGSRPDGSTPGMARPPRGSIPAGNQSTPRAWIGPRGPTLSNYAQPVPADLTAPCTSSWATAISK